MKNLYKRLLTAIGVIGLWLGTSVLVLAQTPVLLKSGTASNFVYGPSEMYFSVDGFLWKTDGTPAGTVQIKNNAGQPVSYSQGIITNGRFYFLSTNPQITYGDFIMFINASGIAQPVPLPTVIANSSIGDIFSANNQLYFVAYTFPVTAANSNYISLWRLGVTSEQTTLLGSYGDLLSFAVYKNTLYYTLGNNLWQVNGLANPVLTKSSVNGNLLVANNFLYVLGTDQKTGKTAVWQLDGTEPNTQQLSLSQTIPAGQLSNSDFFQGRVVDDQLYLLDYSSLVRSLINTVYKVNSSNASIEEAKEIYEKLPVGISRYTVRRSNNFVNFNGLFYYSAGKNGVNNLELWRSDGTLVKDIQSGEGSSDPQNLYVFNGKLYFSATASFIGRIMYRSDGTEAGTQPVTDITGSFIFGDAVLFSYKNDTYLNGNGGLYKLTTNPPTSPTTTGLTLTTPTYDCTTGLLSLSTTGGNGQPIDYRIAGIRDYGSSATFTVPAYQRTNTSFTLEARQSGVVVSLPFVSACQSVTTTPPTSPTSPTQPTGTGLTLTTPAYDCNSGQLTLATNGGNGTPIDFRIAGLRDYGPSPTFTVPAYQRLGTSFTLEARQSGQVVTLPFTSACQSTTTTPTQPTGGTLSVSAQALNCQTGAFQLTTTGGDGTPIDFKVPGLRDYSSSPTFTVPAYQRTNTTFTLYARQSGREVTATYAAACPVSGRLASAEPNTDLRVVVYPNPVGEQFSVGVSGASGQAVRFHLTNLSGQTMIEQRTQVSSDAHTETMKLPASGAGLYLLQVSAPNQSRTVKVLKP